MSLLMQSARRDQNMSLLLESQGPLITRTTNSDDESSAGQCSPHDTQLSAQGTTLPKSIDWSLTYSSDEESQKQGKRARSFSEPGLENSAMRRRPRSLTFDPRAGMAPFSAPAATAPEDTPSRSRFTPMMCLAALFFISCYTTFWLPYPEIVPVGLKENFRPPAVMEPPITAKSVLRATPQNFPSRGDAWMHARMEHAREPLIFRKDEDPLVKFYQQEAFTAQSYTKEINIGMLVVVSLWAVVEYRRRHKASHHVMEL